MNCPNCNAQITGTSKFCTKCGFKLIAAAQPIPQPQQAAPKIVPPQPAPTSSSGFCTSCGAVINPNMKFCTKCGLPVGAQQAPSLLRVKTNEKIKIDGQEFIIGKKKEMVSYCISDNPAVSRVHAKLVKRDGQYFIIDMGSTNHTFVDGTQAPANLEVPVRNGAKIRISNEEFVFQT